MFISTLPGFSFLRVAGVLAGLCLGTTALAQTAPTWLSARSLGPGATPGATAVDAAGNIYLAGQFSGSISLGGTTLTSTGDADGYLAKLTPSGTLAWIRQLGSAGYETVQDVAVDAAGNVYITGAFRNTVALGNSLSLINSTAGAERKAFLVRYSPDGTPQWAQQSTIRSGAATNNGFGSGLGLDAAGNVYMTGQFSRSLTIGTSSISIPNNAERVGIYLARFTAATGALQSLTSSFYYATSSGSFFYPKLAVAPDGAAYLVSIFTESPIFSASQQLFSIGTFDVLTAHYNAQGTFEWVRQLGGAGQDIVTDAAVDAAGNLYVAGGFEGLAMVGSLNLYSKGSIDGFLLKYSPQGTLDWAQTSAGPGSEIWSGVSVDAANAPYVVGSADNGTQIGTQTVATAGSDDVVVAAYTPQGTVRWVKTAGGPGSDFGQYLFCTAPDELQVLGRFRTTAAFASLSLSTTAADGDIFLARLGAGPLSTQAARPQALGLYPNPATDQLHLPALPAGTRVQLVDAVGRVAREATVSAAAQVSVRGLLPGLYTLRATDAKGQQFAGKVAVE
ncbi:SBBP repeat-containing protein [Hymenobacter lucidus]|uniref:SBBP repeat-containing protein n=1 Tax=Hymenobacter lucidus TaxID=2880930 RepID=A0ABS8ARR6_9BACT|nr:SBBP repeat-containing protein [Hymenobacter lucidus]MCB2408779.1 SBBP repeat-containing protein [Hymenobacter lucidus]